jgi:hypothetical protein
MVIEHEPLYAYNGDIDLDEFREMVAKSAYYRAEKREFEAGHELDDWLEAEQEIKKLRRYWWR